MVKNEVTAEKIINSVFGFIPIMNLSQKTVMDYIRNITNFSYMVANFIVRQPIIKRIHLRKYKRGDISLYYNGKNYHIEVRNISDRRNEDTIINSQKCIEDVYILLLVGTEKGENIKHYNRTKDELKDYNIIVLTESSFKKYLFNIKGN